MTKSIMPDIRHISLAGMMMTTIVICDWMQMAVCSGSFQLRVDSLLHWNGLGVVSDSDPSDFDCLGNISKQKLDNSEGMDECRISVDVCLSHHLLPVPRQIQCTLGHQEQTTWRQNETIGIPFTYKWPGAMTVSVTGSCLCYTDHNATNRTVSHIVFSHALLPTKRWTRISKSEPKPDPGSDFKLPPRQPQLKIQPDSFDILTEKPQSSIPTPTGFRKDTKCTSNIPSVEALKINRKEATKQKPAQQNVRVFQSPTTPKLSIQEKKTGRIKLNEDKNLDLLEISKPKQNPRGQTFLDVIHGQVDSTELIDSKDETNTNNSDSKDETITNTSDSKDETNTNNSDSKDETITNTSDSKDETNTNNSDSTSTEENIMISEIIPNENTFISNRIGGTSLVFRVVCQQHYFGNGCSDFCRPKDDIVGHFRCSDKGEKLCLKGWSGSRCTTAVCARPCPNDRGTCSRPDQCTCKPGWYGEECEHCRTSRGCLHGRCENKPGQCLCHKGWTGPLCDVESLYCVDNKPCHNNGKCVHDQAHNYTCHCLSGYTGTNCQVPECHDHFCLHGGTCLTSEGTRYCLCPPPFTGPRCQHFDMHDPESSTNLEDTNNHQTAKRAHLSSSKSNQTDVCDDVIQCQNGGKCIRSRRQDGFGCKCKESYEGEFCEIDTRDPCLEYFCINKGKCKVKNGEPRCSCKSGFSGDFCEVKTTVCPRQVCEHGGTCILHKHKYKCVCRNNFYGKRCEKRAGRNKNKKGIKVRVWSVRVSSTKQSNSCMDVQPLSTFGVTALVWIVHKLVRVFSLDFGLS